MSLSEWNSLAFVILILSHPQVILNPDPANNSHADSLLGGAMV